MPLLVLVLAIIIVVVVIFLATALFGLLSGAGNVVKGLRQKKAYKERVRLAEIELEKQKLRQEHEKDIASLNALGLDGEHVLGTDNTAELEH